MIVPVDEAFSMAMLTVAVVLLRKFDWIEDIPLLFTVLITHIGLLMWETRYVSMSLAYPGLKPRPNARDARSAQQNSSVTAKEAGAA